MSHQWRLNEPYEKQIKRKLVTSVQKPPCAPFKQPIISFF